MLDNNRPGIKIHTIAGIGGIPQQIECGPADTLLYRKLNECDRIAAAALTRKVDSNTCVRIGYSYPIQHRFQKHNVGWAYVCDGADQNDHAAGGSLVERNDRIGHGLKWVDVVLTKLFELLKFETLGAQVPRLVKDAAMFVRCSFRLRVFDISGDRRRS